MKIRFSFTLLIAAGALVSTVLGFVANYNPAGQRLHWDLISADPGVDPNIINPKTRAVRFFIGSGAYSAANRDAELNAVRAAFAQWQAAPGTILKFEEGGLMDGNLDVNTHDNTNLVYWAKNSTLVFGGRADITGATAFTFYDFFSDNTLAEADIVMNGVNFSWFTDFSNPVLGSQFVEGILAHEIGHFIGLEHSPIGGATMLARGLSGVNTQAGLSPDEIAAAVSLYPKTGALTGLGQIQGAVRANGNGVPGAVIVAEDAAGNVISGTLSRPDGRYELPALPPGNYQMRASPLDPAVDGRNTLVRGADISTNYLAANTAFFATANFPVAVKAGAISQLDFAVGGGNPPFRIYRIGRPGPFPTTFNIVNAAIAIPAPSSNLYIAVYSPDLPTSDATLSLSGNGVTIGAPIFQPNASPGLNLISAPLNISTDATPGLRTLIVQRGNAIAYANGFLEISPAFPDFNFDGLDDRFQRRYFARFTDPQAGPAADPDQDGFNNLREFLTGSNPIDPLSFNFRILRAQLLRTGTAVTWESAPGKRYQLLNRSDFSNGLWQAVGTPITATSTNSQALDPGLHGFQRFYRVQAAP